MFDRLVCWFQTFRNVALRKILQKAVGRAGGVKDQRSEVGLRGGAEERLYELRQILIVTCLRVILDQWIALLRKSRVSQ